MKEGSNIICRCGTLNPVNYFDTWNGKLVKSALKFSANVLSLGLGETGLLICVCLLTLLDMINYCNSLKLQK